MSVKFKAIQRINPLSTTKSPSKYYAQAISDGELPFEELLEILS